jgi:phosphatidylinositol glycan class B
MIRDTLREDPSFRKALFRSFAIGSIFYLLAAFLPVGYLHPDQHFQTLEFAHFKLHPSHEERMPWEYRNRMRPWTQPWLYAAALRGMEEVGIERPFIQDAVIRLATGLAGMASLLLFCIALARWLPSPGQRRWLALTMGLFWFFPYHFTRTASETASSILLLLALSALALIGNPTEKREAETEGPFAGPMNPGAGALVVSAICFGLMFNLRYQMGFVIIAAAAWLLLVQRIPLLRMIVFCAVVGLTVAFGLLLDRFGYGSFAWVPWNYLEANLIAGKAASFGTEPWYYYALFTLILPAGPLLMAACLVFWVRFPRSLLSWILLAFLAVHVVLSHKEIRFLAPIAPLAVASVVFAMPEAWFRSGHRRWPVPARPRWAAWLFAFFVLCNLLALVVASVRPPRPAITVHQWIQRAEPEHFEFWSLGATPYRLHQTGGPRFEFYAPQRVTQRTVENAGELARALESRETIYFYHPGLELPAHETGRWVKENCRRVYRSLDPRWRRLDYLEVIPRLATSVIYRCSRTGGADTAPP